MCEFNRCPRCRSLDVVEVESFEERESLGDDAPEDTDGRECLNCDWFGEVSELVCAEDDE